MFYVSVVKEAVCGRKTCWARPDNLLAIAGLNTGPGAHKQGDATVNNGSASSGFHLGTLELKVYLKICVSIIISPSLPSAHMEYCSFVWQL